MSATNVYQVEQNRPNINVAAERLILAGLAQYGNSIFSEISEVLTPTCFTSPDNIMFYDVTKNILETSEVVDLPSFMATASTLGYKSILDKKETLEYIKSIFTFSVSKQHIKKNAVLLRKLGIIRDAQNILRETHFKLSSLNGSEPIGQIISEIEGPILGIDFGTDNNDDITINLGDVVDDVLAEFESLEGKIAGIPSPWPRYNKLIGGCRRPGYVFLTVARPKVGKTQMGIYDSLFVASKLKIPVLYIDTEMKKSDVITRVIASMTNLPFDEIETGSYKDNDFKRSKVYEAKRKLKESHFHYRKVSGKPFEEILSIIRKWVVQTVGLVNGKANPCLLYIDYFKLMNSADLDNMREDQVLGFQISSLSDFCGKYEIPCSAFVQMNRQGIDKETSDILSQSDRLLWLCGSVALLKRKTPEEIDLDGPENGNIKLIPTEDQRFGAGLEPGDWINLKMQKDRCIIEEGLTNHELKQQKKNNVSDSGFATITEDSAQNQDTISNQSDTFSDEDFDGYNYRDEQYRLQKNK